MSAARNILVVANETVVGPELIDAVKRHADEGPVTVHVICPQDTPKHGYVIYDESVRGAAENRLQMTVAQLGEAGIEASGEVMDPDPFTAITDAVGERRYDEIIISTHPETRSGWLRQGLVERVEGKVDCPVEHVVVDLDPGADEATRTLVIANQTVGGQALIDQLAELAHEGPRRFVVIAPTSGDDDDTPQRLAATLERLKEEGLEAIGQVGHPDPFTAVNTALAFYGIDEVVISTLPETRSGWLREDLVGRVRTTTSKPVHHVVSEAEDADSRTPSEDRS